MGRKSQKFWRKLSLKKSEKDCQPHSVVSSWIPKKKKNIKKQFFTCEIHMFTGCRNLLTEAEKHHQSTPNIEQLSVRKVIPGKINIKINSRFICLIFVGC